MDERGGARVRPTRAAGRGATGEVVLAKAVAVVGAATFAVMAIVLATLTVGPSATAAPAAETSSGAVGPPAQVAEPDPAAGAGPSTTVAPPGSVPDPSAATGAVAACPAGTPRQVRMAIKPVKPFVFDDGPTQPPRGFSIELWELIAGRLGLQTTYVRDTTVNEVLDSVRTGRADAGIAAISITKERSQELDFSVPVFTSGLDVLVPAQRPTTFGDTVSDMFGLWALRVLGVLIVMLFVAGTVVWLIERGTNEEFHRDVRGIPEGMWWAVVTMATVGYGDRVTRTHLGRVFAVVWILIGIVFIAQFTATVTARLTTQSLTAQVTNLDGLAGQRVATVDGTAAAQLLDARGMAVDRYANVDELVTAVATGKEDAAVYDGPVLRYAAQQDARVAVSGKPLTLDYYGIVFPQGAPLRECVDGALLSLVQDGTWQRLSDSWFG